MFFTRNSSSSETLKPELHINLIINLCFKISADSAIFPGISKEKRKDYINEYIYSYNEEPIRTITIIHDLVGLLNFVLENKTTINSFLDLLNDEQISFEGLDGKFSFENNLITRNLKMLRIVNGSAKLVK